MDFTNPQFLAAAAILGVIAIAALAALSLGVVSYVGQRRIEKAALPELPGFGDSKESESEVFEGDEIIEESVFGADEDSGYDKNSLAENLLKDTRTAADSQGVRKLKNPFERS